MRLPRQLFTDRAQPLLRLPQLELQKVTRCAPTQMSLLKHAKQYLANQSKYAHLNAFVSLAEASKLLSRTESSTRADVETGSHNVRDKPIAVKDNICTKDLKTTASSEILKDFVSPYDATVVKLLQDAGAVVAGKTNLDEFGMGSHTTHSHAGPVKMQRYEGEEASAGGSSGGSALAVASAQCWAALGTDTGGSVRLPAAYTGVVGFKPSYGLLSRWGVLAYANSLDTVGILGKNVGDVDAIFGKLGQVFARNHQSDVNGQTSSTPTTLKILPHFLLRLALVLGEMFQSDPLLCESVYHWTTASLHYNLLFGVPGYGH